MCIRDRYMGPAYTSNYVTSDQRIESRGLTFTLETGDKSVKNAGKKGIRDFEAKKFGPKSPSQDTLADLDNKPPSQTNLDSEREYPVPRIELKSFPSRKTTMNFAEFCEVFNQAIAARETHDEILQSCFAVFDSDNKGFIDATKIQEIFEVFKEKIPEVEIQSNAK
eukprot:TRINITY_DN6348_c0_g1_i1.p1 TRINITY_DN6348_c0_g1~~TRINITY_DN6348_c0_g1_i1.p1  ORF type:complete len:166 (+),score=49.48 TRINITY_DN6348_c0_g1_i1:64-561(+)